MLPPVFGQPPWQEVSLGLACLNGVLRGAGVETQWWLLCREMLATQPALHAAIDRASSSERGGLFTFDPALVLDCIEPGSFPLHADLGLRIRTFVETALAERVHPVPDAAFIYVSTSTAAAAAACGHALRSRGCFVAMGGPGVERLRARQLMVAAGACDVAIVRDGEPPVEALVEVSKKGGSLREVPSATFLDERHELVTTPQVRRVRLADLPAADLSGLDIVESIPLAAARGCTRDCTFCSERAVWGGFRLRPPTDVAREMLDLAGRYEGLPIFFRDDLINANPRWVDRLCTALSNATDEPPSWKAFVEPHAIDDDRAERMGQAGLRDAMVGVQHFSVPILERMRRPTDVHATERVLHALDRAGIGVGIDIIVGFPGETEAAHALNLREVSRLLSETAWVTVGVHRFCIVDGSAVEMFPEQFGVQIVPWQDRDIPAPWRHLAPLITQFPRAASWDPPPEVAARRQAELKKVIGAAGRLAA